MIEPPKLYTHDRLIFDIREIESLASLIIDLAIPVDFVLRESFERLVELAGTRDFLPYFSKIQETILNLKHGRKRTSECGMIVPLSSLTELSEWAKKSVENEKQWIENDLFSTNPSHITSSNGGLIGNMEMLSKEILVQDYPMEMAFTSQKTNIIDLSSHHPTRLIDSLSNYSENSSALLFEEEDLVKTEGIMNRTIEPTKRQYVFKRVKKTQSGKFIPSL